MTANQYMLPKDEAEELVNFTNDFTRWEAKFTKFPDSVETDTVSVMIYHEGLPSEIDEYVTRFKKIWDQEVMP